MENWNLKYYDSIVRDNRLLNINKELIAIFKIFIPLAEFSKSPPIVEKLWILPTIMYCI